jgi:signal transduction histidine kinase
MRERVRQFGGSLDIRSSQSGTRVTVEFAAMHPLELAASAGVGVHSVPEAPTSVAKVD